MKRGWKLGFAETTIQIHFTFWLLLAFVAFRGLQQTGSIAATGADVAFLLSIFACVVLHELGHSLAARHFGIRTRDITLLPIGGVARLERMPENPRQELVVALAGPAVNFAIVLLIAGGRLFSAWVDGATPTSLVGPDFVSRLAVVNLSLGLFNLIPAFPMDGGRVLRALLATRISYVQATRWAATVGRSLAVLFVLTGIFVQPFLALIGIFVWFGAGSEWKATRLQHAFRGVPLASVMDTNYAVLSPSHTLSQASLLALSAPGNDYPVVESGRVVGLVTEQVLSSGQQRLGPYARVSEIMERDFATAHPSDPMDVVIARMMQTGRATLVLNDQMLAGLVTPLRLSRMLDLGAVRSG